MTGRQGPLSSSSSAQGRGQGYASSAQGGGQVFGGSAQGRGRGNDGSAQQSNSRGGSTWQAGQTSSSYTPQPSRARNARPQQAGSRQGCSTFLFALPYLVLRVLYLHDQPPVAAALFFCPSYIALKLQQTLAHVFGLHMNWQFYA